MSNKTTMNIFSNRSIETHLTTLCANDSYAWENNYFKITGSTTSFKTLNNSRFLKQKEFVVPFYTFV